MKKRKNNFAFIDSQNLNLGVQKLGWKLDYRKFRNLYDAEKLETVLSPDLKHCSVLLQKAARDKIRFMDNLRAKLEYIRKAPPRDKTRGGASP